MPPKEKMPTAEQLAAARALAEQIAAECEVDVRSVEKAMRGEDVRGLAGKVIAQALEARRFKT